MGQRRKLARRHAAFEAALAGIEKLCDRLALVRGKLLYTLFARSCDPVPDYLRLGGTYSDAQVVEMMLATAFDGLGGGTSARAPQRKALARRKAA